MPVLVAQNYRCIPPCTKSFSSQRGLTKHQATCSLYLDVTSKDLFEAVQKEELTNKRRKTEHGEDAPSNELPAINAAQLVEVQPGPGCSGVTGRTLEINEGPSEKQPVEEIAAPEELGRGKRRKWQTRRYLDPRPEPPPPLPEPADHPSSVQFSPVEMQPQHVSCRTPRNANGLYREFVIRPTFVPDEWTIVADSSISGHIGIQPSEEHPNGNSMLSESPTSTWFTPFLNVSSFRLMKWFWGGPGMKSIADLQTLADDVLKAPDFRKEDLEGFSARLENKKLDNWTNPTLTAFDPRDGWIQATVEILLPTRCKHSTPSEIPRFTIPGLHYRPVVKLIQEAFQSKAALRYHYTPFMQFWQKTDNTPPQRVYDEIYSGDLWLKLHAEIQALPRALDDAYERVVAGLMLWSDSTHLTNFGSASLWPLYLYFGNLSKYERAKPSSHSCFHLAYLPKLPDRISEAFKAVNGGKLPTNETLTHCKRDLMQALLLEIFDESFVKACAEGMVIKCVDGITRRVFPRILTWSADYPEKVLLASIRFLSFSPCPRCLIKKSQAHRLGSLANESVVEKQPRIDSYSQQQTIDSARTFIYRDGRGVKSTVVEAVLASRSLVPTFNTLSKIFSCFGHNFYRIFVVDFLHEIELGLWKVTFVHLIRILTVCGQAGVIVLNERYRLISTFGSDTIRKFTNDASSMKKLAARDYEDLLLCSMPVFEGLFPGNHDTIVQDLLFALLFWHGIAKLRLHTEKTIHMLQEGKRRLGAALRKFQDVTCQAYETHELPSERAQRERREARKMLKRSADEPVPGGQGPVDHPSGDTAPDARARVSKGKGKRKRTKSMNERKQEDTRKETKESKRKKFNLNTYKAHALEHYVDDIRQYGTVDSFSTQIGELEHRTVKNRYARTNKYNIMAQMTKIERRQHLLRRISDNDPGSNSSSSSNQNPVHVGSWSQPVPFGHDDAHHHISNSRNDSMYLPAWLRQHIYDPAVTSFRRKLKDHLLRRILKTTHEDAPFECSEADRSCIQIEYDRLYEHKAFRVNYTTYYGQRRQDSMNPRSHSDVMVFAQRGSHETHPYLYARIIGIFHAIVRHTGSRSTTDGIPLKMQFLWVRWLARNTEISKGLVAKRLETVSFVPSAAAFGFLDPDEVIRGVHLIPAFQLGKTAGLLPRDSIGRRAADEGEDWCCYYVNSFVDRDMLMRYIGGGVGHTLLQLDEPEILQESTTRQSVFTQEVEDQEVDNLHERVVIDNENDEVTSVDEDREDELVGSVASCSDSESGASAAAETDMDEEEEV